MVYSMQIPWLELFRLAAACEEKGSIIIALATVNPVGDPQVRSVVCRRIDDDGRIWITSDTRSPKHRQLVAHPRAAAVAWLSRTREQFRFNATVEILDSSSTGSARAEFWRSLPSATRETFFWPPPGEIRDPGGTFPTSNDAADPPPSFGLLVLSPIRVEHLVLRFDPHQARRWDRSTNWATQELNP